MPRSRKYLPEYLSFTRKERVGIITVAVLIILFILIPFLFPFFIKPENIDQTAFKAEIDRLNGKKDSSAGSLKSNHTDYNVTYIQSSDKHYYGKPLTGELFYFDPNTLSVEGWKRLGIREKTAITIQKYTSKGGRFYKPEDIGKIWGLHKNDVSRLLPYVKIEDHQPVNYKSNDAPKTYARSKNAMVTIDINNADTSAFIALPGIGSKLAARIIAFRERLGGFCNREQVGETYGLADSVFHMIKDKLVLTTQPVKKLNINTATIDELKSHPYLRYNIANAIVQYRIQHGNFTAVTEIKKIMMITEDIFNKVSPYLTVK